MADQHGSTRLTLGIGLAGPRPADTLLDAVRKAVAADFDVLGELGRGSRGKVVYLGRERTSGHLVALQLVPAPGGEKSGDMFLDVLRKLDGSVPAAEAKCPNCGDALRGWLRYCSHCGADLSGVAPDSGPGTSRAQLLEAVREAAGQTYEVLGEMPRVEGGGIVYFARERATGKIGALRLQQREAAPDGRKRYELGRTRMLDAVVQDLVGPAASEAPAPPPAAPPSPPKPTPLVAPPAAPPVVTAPPTPPTPGPSDGSRIWKVAAILAGIVAAALAVVVLVRGGGSEAGSGPASGTGTDSVPVTATVAVIDSGRVQMGGKLPADATITVDDQPVSGASIALPPGPHTLRVTAKGYQPASQEIDVPPGQTVIWTPQLLAARADPPRPRPKPRPPTPPRPEPTRDTLIVAAQQTGGSGDGGGPTGVSSTCASLFGHLEWSRALSACTQEAGQGGVAAQRTVGIMHERGLATEPNHATAASWYRKAADGGDRIAQYRLGILLRDGRGIKRDEKLAVQYFQRAGDQGEPDAQFAMGQMLEKGKGVRKNREEAAGWYLRAAERGQADAQYALGILLAKGEGVAKSEAEAVTWFQRAAAQGHRKALEELRKRGRSPT